MKTKLLFFTAFIVMLQIQKQVDKRFDKFKLLSHI